MTEVGIVRSWQKDDQPKAQPRGRGFWPQNKGFGFIERENGDSIFVHKTNIQDGNALLPETEVHFDVETNDKKPGQLRAINVTGGVCFHMGFLGSCNRSDCIFSHKIPEKATKKDVSVDEAVAEVVKSRHGPAPLLVDTVEACRAQCQRLAESGVVAVDFEGVNLCRDGELLLAQCAAPDGQVVLIDVAVLGQAAFDEGGLRELLQSETVLKIIYDCRTDADALYHLCATKLTNVCDCQVLCAFYRDKQLAIERSLGGGTAQEAAQHTSGQKPRLSGLGRALTMCKGIKAEEGKALAALKKAVQPLFVPEYGGSYESWRQRPLSPALLEYAAADVAHLHTLRASWSHLCTEERMSEVTSERIERTIMAETMAKGAHMAERDFGYAEGQ